MSRDAPHSSQLVFCSPPVAGQVPLLDRLEAVKAAGFTAISLQPTDVWALEEQGMSASEVAARIADAGLTVGEVDCTACWLERHKTQGGDDDLSLLLRSLTAERVVETAARIGARSVVAVDLSDAPFNRDEVAEGFAAVCDLAAEHGLLAHIEFLPMSPIRSLTEAWSAVEAAGRANGGLTVDSWHFFRSGSSLDDLARIPGKRIHTVQLNDAPATPAGDMWDEMMNARLLPGQGAFDLAGLIGTLDRIGSTAPLGVEVFNARHQNQTIAQIAQDWAQATRAMLAKVRGPA